ncbi:hypothetical protein SCLCIDRAFT_1211867 [Scleroderma citrinum Foug A]|uniref:Uncharacterized protein n=1 Tax=Scleroderma citrinum Foug A TaxID=1036808 RepID=A0A0C3ALN4_9AGAM|nr:hypothetical protein SCLCIDRAFT_1211867 [Scleroderma citrinum Foug A]
MTRRMSSNRGPNYGTARTTPGAPPPYSPGLQPTNEQPNRQPFGGSAYATPHNIPGPSPPESFDEYRHPEACPLLSKQNRGAVAKTWVIITITCLVTLAFCSSTMPVTWCDDPVDPGVRHRILKEWETKERQYEHERYERDQQRLQWELEDMKHAERLSEWEQERLLHEEELRQRQRREEEERVRLNLAWARVEAHHCTTYATREYTAQLTNLPADYKYRLDACRVTPLEIHGITYTPRRCEEHGQTVIGYWEVNENEPDCRPWWNWYKDKVSCSLWDYRA